MDGLIRIFNDRELALIIWIIIFLFYILLYKKVKTSIYSLFKAFFYYKILLSIFAMIFYTLCSTLFLYKLHFWDYSLIKDTIYWLFGSAFIMLMNSEKAIKNEYYFKDTFLKNIKMAIVIEFIVNLYTFNFWIELIIIPLLVIFGGLKAVSELKKEYLQVNKFLNFIIGAFGILIILFTLNNIFGDLRGFITIENLRVFLLAPILTILYMPFIYTCALIFAYERLFKRLDIFLKGNKELTSFAKLKVFKLCLFTQLSQRSVFGFL